MKYDFQYKITFRENAPFNVDFINRVCDEHPNQKILIEIPNTKGITSQMLRQIKSQNVAIRIAGGYDDDRVRRRKDTVFNNGETGQYYIDAVIYTRNETIKIVEAMEKIEAGMQQNWSELQKAIYVYDQLKTGIMYDPKYEQKFSSEIRSLRGLVTKQTVCAGYSLIMKELMDRQGIDCEYVEGHTHSNGRGGHAWNILNIGGKKYPIDLTWDNTSYRSGKSKTFDWLGQDLKAFCAKHFPLEGEKTQNYEKTLSQIPPQFITGFYNQIGRVRNYKQTTYEGTRKDGSRYIIAQVGDEKYYNTTYYRYYYVDVLPDGRKSQPLLLYSETNLTNLINRKRFGEKVPIEYAEAISNILFSKENILDSLNRRTFYIGKATKDIMGNKRVLVKSVSDIQKSEENCQRFNFPTRRFTRSDGTEFIAQQMLKEPFVVNGVPLMRYDIFEMVKEDGEDVLKRNTVYKEKNFFHDKRKAIPDNYLSRERLDRKVGETGGYIGFLDEEGIRRYNPDLARYFDPARKVDIDTFERTVQTPKVDMPTFDELKQIASKYMVHMDLQSDDPTRIEIRDINTGEVVKDQEMIDKAMLANIWLAAAGVKYMTTDKRPGYTYAFNDSAEDLYNLVCQEMKKQGGEKGVINTVALFKNIEDQAMYKHSRDIVVNLFRTPKQTELINKMILQSIGKKATTKPEPLYSMSYAGSLAYVDSSALAM